MAEICGSDSWETLEELLLAGAVKRHGLGNWNQVAAELQSRAIMLQVCPAHFTAEKCKSKYDDLAMRYNNYVCQRDADTVPWFGDLRKRRVAHLKRELERSDGSIGMLKLKLKRLKAEKNQWKSSDELGYGDTPAVDSEASKKREKHVLIRCQISIPKGFSDQSGDGNILHAFDTILPPSAQQINSNIAIAPNRGFEEKSADCEGIAIDKQATDCDQKNEILENEDHKQFREVKESDGAPDHKQEEGSLPVEGEGGNEPNINKSASVDFGEEGSASDENSCKEADQGDDLSFMSKRSRRPKIQGKFQPLLKCLRTISAHKFASLFKHNQENEKYDILIKRKIDLASVRSKLEEGAYSSSLEFFRDLMLVFTNGLVYYSKDSQGYSAALVLRRLAMEEMDRVLKMEASIRQDKFYPSKVFARRKIGSANGSAEQQNTTRHRNIKRL